MKKYVRVEWQHSSPEEPVVSYSELNDERFKTRKIEVFHDERLVYASRTESSFGTTLGVLPIAEIARLT
ncbi:MAG: hypothetical protein JO170_14400 [Verrucomicrobia bacterium]|nr:hypothetical protein [Verrucomicrobiota bacterium]